VNGVLYVTAPDNVWALDANDGHLIWRYFWRTRGGTHIGNRGAAMWRNYLFFVTPDDYLISLDARTGKERWSKEIANFNQQYFLTSAPVVVDNHVIVGSGNDLDSPWLPPVIRSRERQPAVEVLFGADEPRRPWSRDVEEP
jgi:alcohol dehydrogenase (cytochrome c)